MASQDFHNMLNLLIGLGVGSVISIVANRIGALSRFGAIGAAVLGGLTFYWGGMAGAILLLIFFGGSSLLTRAFPERKRSANLHYAKGGARDLGQVLANGGVAGLALALYASTGMAAWVPAFVGALAAANADTWGTELGPISSGLPRMITTGRLVPAGTSGAISGAGTLASLAGAGLIAVSGSWLFGMPTVFLACTAAGFIGALADSLLGACCQAVYYCPKCKSETERAPLHSCGSRTVRSRGAAWINNDVVNLLATIIGAAVGLVAGLQFQVI
jgi:uncharacterized protein (TIGR00297 family)